MASAEGDKKLIVLRSSDGDKFEVEEAVAMQSQALRHMFLEDARAENGIGIPLPYITSKTLSKVIEYCNKHVHSAEPAADDTAGAGGEDLKKWDSEFVKVDKDTLFDLTLAANYLSIKGLLDLTCQTLADMIKGKTPKELRKFFYIKDDFTPMEEEEIRMENAWSFE